MTKSKAQKQAEEEEKARQQALIDDPGKSPSDENKDSSAAAPVNAGYVDQGTPAPSTDEKS